MPRIPSGYVDSRKNLFFLAKQSGFTLIEMMVAMTIITILTATVLFGYTGYLKNARDAIRIADVSAMDAIVFDYRHKFGFPPASEADFATVVTTANLGQPIIDPLNNKAACITSTTDNTLTYCSYLYITCDGGAGYLISAKFESRGQVYRYTPVPGDPSELSYNIGRCTAIDIPSPAGVPTGGFCTHKDQCLPVGSSVCVGPQPKHCRLKNNQTKNTYCEEDDDCASNDCNTNANKCK